MVYYDNKDNYRKRIHTIQVTLQTGQYKGRITYKIGGNVQGLNILRHFDPESLEQDDIDGFVVNDCELTLVDMDADIFSCNLTNDSGGTLFCDYMDSGDIRNMVVAVEIIDCEVVK